MKIWIINHDAIPPSMGGLVRHYYFSRHLQEMGHDVKIFTASTIHNTNLNMCENGKEITEKVIDGIEYSFIKCTDYNGNGIKRILNIIQFMFKVRYINKYYNKPDVIYVSSPDLISAYSGMKLAKKLNVKVVLEVRDLHPESIVVYNNVSKRNIIIKIMYKLEKWMYKKADKLIFTMPGGKDYIIEHGYDKVLDIKKIYNVNNGVDLDEFNYNLDNFDINDDDLNSDEFFKVVYTGSIRRANNLQTLIDASTYIKKSGIDNIKFIIYGDGTEREQLEEQAKKNNLNVYFKGRVEKKYIASILSKADLNIVNFMQSSVLEKYGCSWNKLFEYMASGKPIISNSNIKYDLITEQNFGVSHTFNNAEEYANEIIRISKLTKEEYNLLCVNAKKYVSNYDYKKLSKDLIKILEK